jgi:hypothetical protein
MPKAAPDTATAPTDEAPAFSEESIALHFAGERAGDARYVAAWSRPVQRIGRIVSYALVGGLHHQYVRI